MSEEEDFIISSSVAETTPRRRFPVVAQLVVLGVLMVLIFSTVIFPFAKSKVSHTNDTRVDTPAPTADSTTLSKTIVQSLGTVTITAHAAYVYDVKMQRSLYNKNADEALPLASISKLMTTLLAEELVSATTTLNIPKAAVLQDGASGLREGERISRQALSDYALIASSNDAAFALGAAVGSVIGGDNNQDQTFVDSMNIRANELGLSSMKFYNPTGLDISLSRAGAYGSARDVSFLLEYIMKQYPDLLKPTTAVTTRIYDASGAYYEAENTDPIINQIPNLRASKTGYTDLAGGNLTVAFDVGFDRPIIITVLGSTFSDRFVDVITLTTAVKKAFAETNT